MVYTINADAFSDVQKTFDRYSKKASILGLQCSLNIIKKYPKQVNTYVVDEVNKCLAKSDTAIIDVMDIDLVYPEYKLGDYTVVAVIEHGEKDKNLVHSYNNYPVPIEYYSGAGRCQHCGTKHHRAKTILLVDNNTNELIQVGTSCLKEFAGVTDISLVQAYLALSSIIEYNESNKGFIGIPTKKYQDTLQYLSKCIHVYNKIGYTKDNKNSAEISTATEADIEVAQKVIDFYSEYCINNRNDYNYEIFNNIKNILTSEYCTHNNGYVAYAYPLYLKLVEKLESEKQRKENSKKYSYFGNVGNKVELEVTGRCVGSYSSYYNHYSTTTTYIYKFIDKEDKHIFIWKTSNDIPTNEEGVFTGILRGTIKEHTTYSASGVEEPQTVLTRCKVIL